MVHDDDAGPEVVTPKRRGLSRRAIEKSALQHSWSSSRSSDGLAIRAGQSDDRPSYSQDYLDELRSSTPSTPKDLKSLSEETMMLDIVSKFGSPPGAQPRSSIPTEAEIKAKKERRARRAHGQDYISLDDDGSSGKISLLPPKQKPETRLVRDDEDFAEGFEEFVEDGKISLGRKAEREQKKNQRIAMQEMINDAEGISDGDDSEAERNAAYETAQTRAGMDGLDHEPTQRASQQAPTIITPIPRIATVLERLRANLSELEYSKSRLSKQMEDLQKEKNETVVRDTEIQRLLTEAGENYKRLSFEAGEDARPANDQKMQASRGLESFGAADGGLGSVHAML